MGNGLSSGSFPEKNFFWKMVPFSPPGKAAQMDSFHWPGLYFRGRFHWLSFNTFVISIILMWMCNSSPLFFCIFKNPAWVPVHSSYVMDSMLITSSCTETVEEVQVLLSLIYFYIYSLCTSYIKSYNIYYKRGFQFFILPCITLIHKRHGEFFYLSILSKVCNS